MATLDIQVAADTDDASVFWTGAAWDFSTSHNELPVGYDGAADFKYGVGLRFLNVTVPVGATITSAKITVTSKNSNSNDTANSKIHGEKSTNPGTFSDYTDFSGRARTTAVVTWGSIAHFTSGTAYDSPDISAIITEIIGQGGWASGNAMVIFWDDFDDLSTHASERLRDAYSHESDPTKAVNLHITYTVANSVSLSAASFVLTGVSAVFSTVLNVVSWNNKTKHTSSFTNKSKHTSSFTNKTKHTSSWTNKTQH